METFEKNHLIYDYNWARYDRNDPKISGIPDATEFNRTEGGEVLYIIKFLTDHLAYEVRSFGNRVEKLVHDRLPVEIKRQKDTIQWIKDNWRNFAVK
jgi:hypothetical protein